MKKLVVYESREEVIVCVREDEDEIKSLYFEQGDQNINDYDRIEGDYFHILSRIKAHRGD